MTSITDYGATGDGVTDDGHAIRDAVKRGGGGALHFPAGVYYYRATGSLPLPTGTELRGEPGATVILYDTATPGKHTELFHHGGDDVRLHGLTIRKVTNFPAVFLPTRPHRGLTVTDCVFDGGRTGGGDYYTHAISLGAHTGTMTGLTVRDTVFTGFRYPLYQANGTTGATRNVRFRDCVFTRNYATDLEFNAPHGEITNVRVLDCDFSDNLAGTPGAGFAVGLAHVVGAKLRGNTFNGYGNEALHIEDHSTNVTVHDNTFTRCGIDRAAHIRIISGSTGVRVTANHFDATTNTNRIQLIQSTAGGTGLTPGGRESSHPSRVIIEGNHFDAGICDGIYASFCEGLAVGGNVFAGDGGYATNLHKCSGVVTGNDAHGLSDPFRTDSRRVHVSNNQQD